MLAKLVGIFFNYYFQMIFLYKYLIFIVVLMPLLAPVELLEAPLLIAPSEMKLTLAIFMVTSGLFIWTLVSYSNKNIFVIQSPAYWPIFGFLAWSFTSLLWVENGYLATIMLAQFSVFLLVFLLTINIFTNFNKIETLLKFIIFSLALVSVLGLLQYYFFNVDFIKNLFTQIVSPAATFGNKNFASHFVVMTLPLSLVFILTSKTNRQVALYSAVTAVGSWFLIYTIARQAYVAIIVELFVLSLFFALDKWKNKDKALLATISNKKIKLISFFSILIFLIFSANFTNQGFNIESGSNSKISKIQSISIDKSNPRLPAWINTLEMIKDHPIVGVGVGQWQVKYPLYYDRVMKDIIFNESTRLKRLHNEYLEMFANVGLIGYVFLLWLAWLSIRKIWSILSDSRSEYRFYVLGLTLGMVGFLTVSMFSFPIRVFFPAFLLFIFIGLIFSIDSNSILLKFNKYKHLILIIILGIFSIFITWKSLNWVYARHLYVVSATLQLYDENEIAARKGNDSIVLNSMAPEYFYTTGRALHRSGRVDDGILFYKKAVDISPFDTLVLLDLATAYKDNKNLSMEQKVLEFILRVDFKNVQASARLVINLTSSKAPQEATIVYKNMKSNFEYFKDRGNFGPYHDDTSKTARFVRDYKYMEYIYKDLVKKFPVAKSYTKLAATQFYFLNDRKRGIQNYKKALELNPEVQDFEEIKDLITKYESSNK
jgi:O-antigen ligase